MRNTIQRLSSIAFAAAISASAAGASAQAAETTQTSGTNQSKNNAPGKSVTATNTEADSIESATSSQEDLATARLHFSNGVELLRDSPPNYQDAWYQFRLAYEKSGHSWKALGNLGYCALKLERDGEALEHYRRYLKEGGEQVNPKERSDIERELLLLEGNMSWVTITSTEHELELGVSRQGSVAPAQAYQLQDGKLLLGLRAGDFTIVAKHGTQQREWKPLLTPGKATEHHFDFSNSAPVATADRKTSFIAETTPPASEVKEKSPPSPLSIAGYSVAAAGGLALGAGIVTGLMTLNEKDKATDDCINKICRIDNESHKFSAEDLALTTNILFVAGGVLAAGGVTLIIIDRTSQKKSEQVSSLQLVPSFHPTGAGMWLKGQF